MRPVAVAVGGPAGRPAPSLWHGRRVQTQRRGNLMHPAGLGAAGGRSSILKQEAQAGSWPSSSQCKCKCNPAMGARDDKGTPCACLRSGTSPKLGWAWVRVRVRDMPPAGTCAIAVASAL
ncbi:hypothetical protein BDA96_04G372300 [Sorghum bicolor]|uniref:Uncharacterized protein n=2 Tax=Sorghum bicolor TaxID=4558 RepID=A0A1Z5RRA4_SORBI|nr:hypothetical protein BDA96_04G372300 [Sorghum bicolor]OQU85965.1 hypothetical protein SORBI_3004G347866 [Sorghum bicolor]OQU85966.1 hypothetical protein SORBI_3004G347866 [Sorghum bicolor]